MDDSQEKEAHWLKVPEAAKACGLGVRTLYTKLEEGVLQGRKMDGVIHLRLSDCLALSQIRSPEPERLPDKSSPPKERKPDPETDARARVIQQARLESEQRAAELERRAARERELDVLEQEEERRFERELRRRRLELEIETERHQLEMARQREEESRRHEAERKERAERGRLEIEARAAKRRTWERRWQREAADWITSELGLELAKPAAQVVADELSSIPVEETERVVWKQLQGAMRHAFRREFAEREQRAAMTVLAQGAREILRRGAIALPGSLRKDLTSEVERLLSDPVEPDAVAVQMRKMESLLRALENQAADEERAQRRAEAAERERERAAADARWAAESKRRREEEELTRERRNKEAALRRREDLRGELLRKTRASLGSMAPSKELAEAERATIALLESQSLEVSSSEICRLHSDLLKRLASEAKERSKRGFVI